MIIHRPLDSARAGCALALAAALAACRGEAVAPSGDALGGDPAYTGRAGIPATTETNGDTTVTTFTLSPQGRGTVVIGPHKLAIPKGAVCDPATSGYGPGTWDLPCAPTAERLVITAKAWADSAGHPYVEFRPALRFRPTAEGDPAVTLYLRDKRAAAAGAGAYVITYCDDAGGLCVDEGAGDPAVATKADATNGFLYRRLKHFSGYNIASGRAAAAPAPSAAR